MEPSIWLLLLNASVFAIAAAVSALLNFGFIRLSFVLGFLDYPSGRKSHQRPMPFMGGIGIFLAFWLTVGGGFLVAYLSKWSRDYSAISTSISDGVFYLGPKIFAIFLGALVILLVGLLDDRFEWSPMRKLIGQVTAAGILMSLGLTINLFAAIGPLGFVATFAWILLIMNAFNFIDSLDGHCAGVALISCLAFFCITQLIGQFFLGLFLACLMGSLLGFLRHNFMPAKIFLGDNGSLFIGYMMAAMTLLCRYQDGTRTMATAFVPLLAFGVPIYDMISVVLVRLLRGLKPWQGDRNHFAHRLVKIGMSERVAVVFSYFIATTLGVVAVLTTQVTVLGAFLIGVVFLLIIGIVAFLEFYTAERIRVIEKLSKKGKWHGQPLEEGRP